jgi:predicted ATPase
MSITRIKKITIEKFRALSNVEVEFGDHITVVCGKNGTSKSSILGIAAQIFSFEKDYIKDVDLIHSDIAGGNFKSQYREHFRISERFDPPGSMKVNIDLHDGYTEQDVTGVLQLDKRGKSPRPVVRKNSTAIASENSSRNFTHPVIFLSLKRLFPIAARRYSIDDYEYLNAHKDEFIGLTNELLNRQSSQATGTSGTINSAVAHGENYDQESVSAGEDNAGQIILAIMSFRKLKEEYSDYRGGLLLIDEADASLFPTAQINLLKILDRECRDLNLQVVMTSHSPLLIEYAYSQSQQFRRRYKTIYLSNTFGSIQVSQDWSWPQISADINTTTISVGEAVKIPKINVYFEDHEAADFFSALLSRQAVKKFLIMLPDVTLGCSNYLQLIDKKVPEFAERSIVCLDSDAAGQVKKKKPRTVVLLPGHLPPDQLIFEHLYNLPANHTFWLNEMHFTREVFTNAAAEVIREFSIRGASVDVTACLSSYTGNKKPREVFKRFYKQSEFQQLFELNSSKNHPWMHWIASNLEVSNQFLEKLALVMSDVMINGFAVEATKLAVLKIKPRRA